MQYQRYFRALVAAVLVAFMLISTQCIAWSAGNMKEHPRLKTPPKSTVSVARFQLKILLNGRHLPLTTGFARGLYGRRYGKYFRMTGRYREARLTAETDGTYWIIEHNQIPRYQGYTMPSSVATGFTFGIWPTYSRADAEFNISICRDGKVLKTYRYKETVRGWMWLLLAPAMPFAGKSFQKAGHDQIVQALRNAIVEAERDGHLK